MQKAAAQWATAFLISQPVCFRHINPSSNYAQKKAPLQPEQGSFVL
jgi:hypothetical protein